MKLWIRSAFRSGQQFFRYLQVSKGLKWKLEAGWNCCISWRVMTPLIPITSTPTEHLKLNCSSKAMVLPKTLAALWNKRLRCHQETGWEYRGFRGSIGEKKTSLKSKSWVDDNFNVLLYLFENMAVLPKSSFAEFPHQTIKSIQLCERSITW